MQPLGRLAVIAVTGSLLLAGCSDTDDIKPTPPPPGITSRGIDAASYVEDYESPENEDYASGSMSGIAPAPSSAVRNGGGYSVASDEGVGIPEVPGPLDDDTFVDAGTSGFVATDDDELSTFALDVDTGSWGVARTLLRDGYLPPPASIRVEEWVNAQPDDLPEPDGTMGVSADSAISPSLTDGTQLVRVGVNTREVTAADRRPVNITLVVDRSGSMDIRERLGLVQSSLALLADSLRDDDTISVVSFEDQAKPILEPTPVSDTDAILAAIDRLKPGGSTNLEAGLRLGYEEARKSFRADATNIVLLASDGVANVGRTGPGSLVDEIQSQGADGIHLVTVGYGMGNYNDHLMEQLADLGDGFYAYVDDFAEAERLFRDELATSLVPVAAEARAQVEFDPSLVASYRLVGYDNRDIADEDFDDQSVDAGELGAGHHATALYEVRLADGVEPGTPIGTATVQWTSVEKSMAERTSTERASVELVAADASQPEGSLALEAAVADFAQLLKGAAPYDDRDVTLGQLADRVDALVAADVPGAEGVARMIELAQQGRSEPVHPGGEGPIR